MFLNHNNFFRYEFQLFYFIRYEKPPGTSKTRLRVKSKTAGRLFQNKIKTMARPCQDHVFQEYVFQEYVFQEYVFQEYDFQEYVFQEYVSLEHDLLRPCL